MARLSRELLAYIGRGLKDQERDLLQVRCVCTCMLAWMAFPSLYLHLQLTDDFVAFLFISSFFLRCATPSSAGPPPSARTPPRPPPRPTPAPRRSRSGGCVPYLGRRVFHHSYMYAAGSTTTSSSLFPPPSPCVPIPKNQDGNAVDELLGGASGSASSSSSSALRVRDAEVVMRAVAAFADHPQVLQVRHTQQGSKPTHADTASRD